MIDAGNETVKVVWKEPPPKTVKNGRSGSNKWLVVLEVLKSHPERWAMISPSVSSGTVNYIRKQLGDAKSQYEFTGRTVSRNPLRYELYARYIGPKKKAPVRRKRVNA